MSRDGRKSSQIGGSLTRRGMFGAASAVATPALAAECRIGPAPHEQGPDGWTSLDRVELDAAYDMKLTSA